MTRSSLSSIRTVYSTDSIDSPVNLSHTTFLTNTYASCATLISDSSNINDKLLNLTQRLVCRQFEAQDSTQASMLGFRSDKDWNSEFVRGEQKGAENDRLRQTIQFSQWNKANSSGQFDYLTYRYRLECLFVV
ncbi:hypothetical protein CPC08DRAFT_70945 [Agrocybe pediades]|nr:hypothetical protein CPC08DRAFT_70945 [Agrocybe pediades]